MRQERRAGWANGSQRAFSDVLLHATHCIEAAGKSADLGNKLSLLNMARAWMLLAEQAEKNSGNVTPGPTKEA
jgi:hypothetical protein